MGGDNQIPMLFSKVLFELDKRMNSWSSYLAVSSVEALKRRVRLRQFSFIVEGYINI